MNLHQLEIFAEVVEKGSFTLAARSLFLSQSAVSTQVRRLERTVGLPLFRRVRGGLVLSEAGRAVYEVAGSVREATGGLETRLLRLRSGESGGVAVGVSHTGALYGLVAAVGAYRIRHPGVEVEVHVELAEALFQKLDDGKLDFGLEWAPVDRPQLAQEPLAENDFLVAVAPGGPLAEGGAVAQDRFREQTYLGLQYGPGSPGFVEAELLKARLLPRRVLRLPSIDSIKRMVEAGLGVSVLSRLSVEREVREGRLAALPLQGFPLRRSVLLLYRRGEVFSPAAVGLLQLLRTGPWLSPEPGRAAARLRAERRRR